MPSEIDGIRAGRHQDLPSGSSATVPVPAGSLGGDFTFAVFVQPTAPGGREAVVASRGRPFDGDGWALVVSEAGTLEAVIGRAGVQARIATGIELAALALVLRGADGRGRRRVGQPPAVARPGR